MSNNALEGKVRELKELKAMQEELIAAVAAIEDEIKAFMTEQGVDELAVDVYKIRWKVVTGLRFDTSAFRKTHSDLYQQYTKQTTSRRFTVA